MVDGADDHHRATITIINNNRIARSIRMRGARDADGCTDEPTDPRTHLRDVERRDEREEEEQLEALHHVRARQLLVWFDVWCDW